MKKIFALVLTIALAFCTMCAFAEESDAYEELSKGSKGEAVTALQERLKELGYYTISVDGDYGNGTLNAVSAFQTRNGLEADGIASVDTLKAIYADEAVAAPKAPAVEVTSIKKDGNNFRFTYKNNTDTTIDHIDYYIITYDGSGRVTTKNTFTEYDSILFYWSEDDAVSPGDTRTTPLYDMSQMGFANYPVVAVGVFSYHDTKGQTIKLAAEQVTFKKSDGTTLFPLDEDMEIRTMTTEDYDEARTVKFGFTSGTINYYATSFYMLPSGLYIIEVEPNSLAEKAGLRVGDVITSFDKDNATFPYSTEFAKLKMLKGEKIEVQYWRANNTYSTVFSMNMDEVGVEETGTNDSSFSVADELLKLADLLERGILTQEEFDAQKAKLLGN